jgi:hypothetical protein
MAKIINRYPRPPPRPLLRTQSEVSVRCLSASQAVRRLTDRGVSQQAVMSVIRDPSKNNQPACRRFTYSCMRLSPFTQSL